MPIDTGAMFEASADMGWVVMEYGGERVGLYRFLWFQHIWFDEGQAENCHELMEGVLHEEGYRLANVQWDLASPVYRTWRRAGCLGPLAAFGHRFWLMAERVKLRQAEGPCVTTGSGV